ncbi:hypothetical protein Daesc_002008 [Daldinia eschscholtzii]|uniref:AA1-like domain-containing protein n=1 Tax=Daldinia eschscholtzii TaxID=292717 RepID=A0AAX6MVR2_9PEZI
MRFTAAAVAALFFGASAMAAPQEGELRSEDVSITEFSVHKSGASGSSAGTVDGVSFKLSGDDAKDLSCSASASDITKGLPTDVITCGDSKYRFALLEGQDSSTFTLRIYHELGLAVGFYGAGDVATYCHSGGLDTMVCSQVNSPVTIHIDGQ